ncbi:hypothetical protein BTVI_135320 [Pitangus sulphuratus]|nr:hypothetical protein BTVI_135320 [Pitangus sulphuratus]
MVGFLGCTRTFSGHDILKSFSSRLLSVSVQPVFVLGRIAPTHMQDLALDPVEFHKYAWTKQRNMSASGSPPTELKPRDKTPIEANRNMGKPTSHMVPVKHVLEKQLIYFYSDHVFGIMIEIFTNLDEAKPLIFSSAEDRNPNIS